MLWCRDGWSRACASQERTVAVAALTQARKFILRIRGLIRRPASARRFERVFVMCPANVVTGGPESLHQLVDVLRRRGHRAFISYYPDSKAPVPAEYAHYNIISRRPKDKKGNLVVFPEVITGEIRKFKKSQRAIWWLSVDNFFGLRPESDFDFETLKRAHEAKLARRQPTDQATWDELRGVLNFSQSAYATYFLQKMGISAASLRDYINPEFMAERPNDERKNVIAYNPRKGMATTETLVRRFPQLVWQPLSEMTRTQVIDALRGVKMYVDFGTHPGCDRFPREAAILGACVLVGRRGSAAFEADVPIPEMYKLDEAAPDFNERFINLTAAIFADYTGHRASFASFANLIWAQKDAFDREVAAIFEISK